MIEEIKKHEEEFEEELRKAGENEDGFVDDLLVEGGESDEGACNACQRLMSHMRKTAVRWLYMEWYKKAVLGLNLPTVSF